MGTKNKPIFVATHPRACSTAFERVFMTRRDVLTCIHEPFGDAYYFGPERLGERYEEDEKSRKESGFSESTYRFVFEQLESEGAKEEGNRIFIKDMAQYWVPPNGQPSAIAPSLVNYKRGVGTTEQAPNQPAKPTTGNPPFPYSTNPEPGNPTVVPKRLLQQFHFTFLIRHPASSIPSYYRCTVPPLDKITGFYHFMPSEAGYGELRQLFDFLKRSGQVGPKVASSTDGTEEDAASTNGTATSDSDDDSSTKNSNDGAGNGIEICVIDADDLLDNPAGIIEAYCRSVGLDYSPSMLKWDSAEAHAHARDKFEKWRGFHEDAIGSGELRPRAHKKVLKPDAELYAEWKEKYGDEAAGVIRDTVAASLEDYLYMKQFALKV